MTTALGLAGFGNIAVAVQSGQKTAEITAALSEGDRQSAGKRALEALVGISMAGARGAGGLLTVLSEPVVRDGKLMMKVRLPFLIQGQPSQM